MGTQVDRQVDKQMDRWMGRSKENQVGREGKKLIRKRRSKLRKCGKQGSRRTRTEELKFFMYPDVEDAQFKDKC